MKKNIEANPGSPAKVTFDFKTGNALIGVQTKSGELIDASVNFTEIKSKKRVTGGRTYTRKTNNPKTFTLTQVLTM